jgi:hypothetical protein
MSTSLSAIIFHPVNDGSHKVEMSNISTKTTANLKNFASINKLVQDLTQTYNARVALEGPSSQMTADNIASIFTAFSQCKKNEATALKFEEEFEADSILRTPLPPNAPRLSNAIVGHLAKLGFTKEEFYKMDSYNQLLCIGDGGLNVNNDYDSYCNSLNEYPKLVEEYEAECREIREQQQAKLNDVSNRAQRAYKQYLNIESQTQLSIRIM